MTDPTSTETARIVTDALYEIMARSGITPPERGPQIYTLPFDEFKLDSMDRLEFVMAIEDKLERVFDANEVVQCRTLADIIALAGH